ncbi:hypothetical protein [Reyranella soli]|uniref:Uncharacterized protein n=1 Tax=Reyranella soli TaxID=1230389 RepID=A0A512NS03_9HYPH|nr:hypothetical protein [Reyranella soli]GEP61719.1 hypothetical protein RSO01_88850 [Reyranella soli]
MDSNVSFLFLVALITGIAVAALGKGRDAYDQGVSPSNALYEVSENWRTSVRFSAAAR